MRYSSFLFFALLLGTTPAHAAEKRVTVTVEAGEYDRRDVVVSASVPPSLTNDSQFMRWTGLSADGRRMPVQTAPTGSKLSFVVPELRKGAQAEYVFTSAVEEPFVGTWKVTETGLKLARSDTKLQFQRQRGVPPIQNGVRVKVPTSALPLLEYQADPGPFPRNDIKELFRRGGYLHPLRTPSGRAVTDDFPPNHIHHHGVWWAWTKTQFDGRQPDFWNMGDGKGRVDFVSLDGYWSSWVHAGFRARHDFVDITSPKPVVVLHDYWEVTAYTVLQSFDYWLLDLVSEQSCATTNALKLPEYYYGGLGFRGNWAWNGKTNVHFLTADGETDRVKGNTQKSRWCDIWGRIDGADCGIAILCHPSNFRAPQPMRLHPTEPFFCYAPQQGGDMEIKPGEPYVSRYRLVVHDGRMDKAELDRIWNDYAHPPVVKVKIEE